MNKSYESIVNDREILRSAYGTCEHHICECHKKLEAAERLNTKLIGIQKRIANHRADNQRAIQELREMAANVDNKLQENQAVIAEVRRVLGMHERDQCEIAALIDEFTKRLDNYYTYRF